MKTRDDLDPKELKLFDRVAALVEALRAEGYTDLAISSMLVGAGVSMATDALDAERAPKH